MSGWENPAGGRRRARWVLPVILLLLAVTALILVARVRSGGPTGALEISRTAVRPTAGARTSYSWRPPPPGTWQVLPPAPLASRVNYTVTWTGSEMIVWGGFDALNRPKLDGASFDPARGRWRALPAAPAANASATAVLAGRDVVFVSSSETWRFDPTGRRWSAGPALPVPEGHTIDDNLVAAGRIVLAVTEPHDRQRPSALFALRPGVPRWQRLPDVPVTMTGGHAILTAGSRMLVYGPPVDDQPAAVALDLDVASPTWRPLAAPPDLDGQDLLTLVGVAAGDRIMLWGARADARDGYAAVWEAGRWRSVDPGPLRPSRAVDAMWTGGRMLVWDRLTNRGALLDPRTDRWARVPNPPVVGLDLAREAVWTGSGLLVWGALGTGGALYTPE